MNNKAVFIAATGQNVGKTTICLGLISSLMKRYSNVGFIKPVGQRHEKLKNGVYVDKDVILFKEHFYLKSQYTDMSPILFKKGFTKDFLDCSKKDDRYDTEQLKNKITRAFKAIADQSDYTIVEGTGHTGVGSMAELNNAQVAKALGLDVILITTGGIGKAFDELALNRAMCEAHGVHVKGVILNRVLENKYDTITTYMTKALKRWNIPLIGCIPYNLFLSTPSIQDFENLFNTQLISGEAYRFRHFKHTRLVATSTQDFEAYLQAQELIITPASREDIIFALLAQHKKHKQNNKDLKCGLILTGVQPAPTTAILNEIKKSDIPALYAPIASYDVMEMITSFIAKIKNEDTDKVQKAIDLVENNIHLDLLCQ